MYLKSIEIQGFKSFANKILFEFHNGITGIVGPNGSGKSNVADAVRWVLGEQRIKQLRGASMQDVIFAGTETRKPQGFAYVAITLDNSDHQLAIDYEQVKVARRIYRSGESEYLLNGSVCRLKDVHELFYDTGIGKEGYSIIGQGQIDKILSGKPEERRELFDEAAGIVKFKRRKTIAQKKLESERQNLVRVSDILSELEKQVGPLARQSEAAKEYLRLKETLKTYDANLFLMETEGIRKQIGEFSERKTVVSDELLEVREQSGKLKEQYDATELQLERLDEQINEERSRFNQAQMQKESLNGQINVLNEQINTERMNSEHIESRIQSLAQEIAERGRQMEGYENENVHIRKEAANTMEQLKKAEDTLRMEDESIMLLDQQVEHAKGNIITALNEKAAINAREQRFEAMLEQIQVRRSEVCQKLLKIKSEDSVQEEQLRAERDKLTEIDERVASLEMEGTVREEQIAELEQKVRTLSVNLNNNQQDYHTTYTKLDSLKNLAERYEGYGNSIRRVMEVKTQIHGIHGVVADLFTTEKEYETAIETALGGTIQNIVTDTENTAKHLIEYLKKNKYGRATFLPLTSMNQRGGFAGKEALKEPGVIGLASDLIRVREEYNGLARYLLGRVVVVKTIDQAIALAKKYQYSLRIVTLEGELLSAGGSMTGGAFKNTSNLLGRKREIEELEKTCEKALHLAERIQEELTMWEGTLAEQKQAQEVCKKQMVTASLEQNTIRMNVSQLEEKRLEIADSSEDLVLENRQLEEQIRDIGRSRTELKADADRIEQQNILINDEIEANNQQLDGAKAKREDYARELARIQLDAANLKQKAYFIMENIHRVQDEKNKLAEEKEGLKEGTKHSGQAIEEKQNDIERLREQIAAASFEREEADRAVNMQLEQKETISKQQKNFFQRREELSERISGLDKDIFRIQNQVDKLEERLENHISYMWNEYELTFSAAEMLRDPEMEKLSDIRKKIDELKQGIKALGHVNVNAIEDYKEVFDRFVFLKVQHDDLIEAEEALVKIIEELDTGMRRQFEEKFAEIRKEFDKVFQELFGGGHGTLELMEDEDILEAGIQIISQPPGKKLQNMMQLSGGEKALTAIALLFAIQNLKPSPFCLLDEIEAALDDSNVDRFAGYLHKLTKSTQFIVITHRRGTMVASDRLYGITMQEKGVSTLVSVNLIEDEIEK